MGYFLPSKPLLGAAQSEVVALSERFDFAKLSEIIFNCLCPGCINFRFIKANDNNIIITSSSRRQFDFMGRCVVTNTMSRGHQCSVA